VNPKAPKLVSLPQEGDDARSLQGQPGGPRQENESVSAEERAGTPRSELSDGPKVGETGNYLPATYKLLSGNICEDR